MKANVVVFVVDTLRRDHLGCYGYPRDVSPVIDALAEEGVLFERAEAVAPRTWQSFTSILTGLYPPRHGVRFIFSQPLDRSVPTMASVLAASGYHTAAFDGMTFVRGMTGNAAFQEYLDPRSVPGKKPTFGDERVIDAFLEWLNRAREPFFAFLRVGSPHWTYICPPVFHDQVEDHQTISHRFNAGTHGLGKRRGELAITDLEAYRRRFYEYDPPPRERDHMILHYDECVHASDAAIGRGLDRLRERGLMDSTITVVTSDHGESFGEHGYLQHGPRVDGPVIDVPLLVRFPPPIASGRKGLRVTQLVRGVDVFPTVLAAIGLEPPAGLDGASLLPAIDGRADLQLTAYAEGGRAFVGVDPEIYLPGVAGKWRMVQDRDWKLIYIPNRGRGILRLYDLKNDPGETRDVAADHPEVVSQLRAALERVMTAEPEGTVPERPLTEEEKERLRALGYL